VFAKHPNTTFVALRVANWPATLDVVSEWLGKFLNMCVELGCGKWNWAVARYCSGKIGALIEVIGILRRQNFADAHV
jgi:hypothetical protein